MSVDQQVADAVRSTLDDLDVPPAPLARTLARVSNERRASRRRALMAAGAVAAVTMGTVGWIGGWVAPAPPPVAQTSAPLPPYDGGVWEQAAASPLSPRTRALTVWTGTEIVVLGGDTRVPCPSPRLCEIDASTTWEESAKQAAAFNLGTNTWRTLQPSPVPLLSGQVIAVGDRLVVRTSADWLEYDIPTNRWIRLPDPPSRTVLLPLSEAGGVIYAGAMRNVDSVDDKENPEPQDIYAFDLATRTWSTVPTGALYAIRGLFATKTGPITAGSRTVGADQRVSYQAGVLENGSWRYVDVPFQQGIQWQWTGRRLLSYSPSEPGLRAFFTDGGARGGLGLMIVGGGILDPVTETSSEWPITPTAAWDAADDGTWALTAGSGTRAATSGYVYDDANQSTTPIVRPPEAPTYGVSAVWAGDALVAFGGYDPAAGWGQGSAMSNTLWIQR